MSHGRTLRVVAPSSEDKMVDMKTDVQDVDSTLLIVDSE